MAADKSKDKQKQMISCRILQKDYLFSYEDYENLYTDLQASISKKQKLPEIVQENSEKHLFDQFFQQLRKKRNAVIMDQVRLFLEEKATLQEKKSKRDMQEGIDIDDGLSEKEESLIEANIKQTNKKIVKANQKKNVIRQSFAQRKAQKYRNLFKQLNEEDKNQVQAFKNYDKEELDMFSAEISDDEDDDGDNIMVNSFFIPSNRVMNINMSVNQVADKNKCIKSSFGKSCKEYLSRFYNQNSQIDSILFQILDNESKLSPNMEERIVSSTGSDRELQQCSICLQLPLVPLKCQNCTQMVCAKCAYEWIQKKNECPQGCQGEWKLCKASEVELDKIVLQQYFYCQFKEFGCLETCKILDLIQHESTCQYKAIPCKFCKNQVVSHQMEDHENKCEYRICKCKECSFNYIAREKSTHNCLKTVLGHYQNLKQKFKKYQLDTEEKLFNFEKQLNELVEQNKNKFSKISNRGMFSTGRDYIDMFKRVQDGKFSQQQSSQQQQQKQSPTFSSQKQNLTSNNVKQQAVYPNKNYFQLPSNPLNYLNNIPILPNSINPVNNNFLNSTGNNNFNNNSSSYNNNSNSSISNNGNNNKMYNDYFFYDKQKSEDSQNNLNSKPNQESSINRNNNNDKNSNQNDHLLPPKKLSNYLFENRNSNINLSQPIISINSKAENKSYQDTGLYVQPQYYGGSSLFKLQGPSLINKVNQDNQINQPIKPQQDQNSNSLNSNESHNQFLQELPMDRQIDFQNDNLDFLEYSHDYYF